MNGKRDIRAILLDVHGVFFERNTLERYQRFDTASIRDASRLDAAESYRTAIKEFLNVDLNIDHLFCWKAEEEASIRLIRDQDKDDSMSLSQKDLVLAINREALKIMFPELMEHIQEDSQQKIAEKVRALRRKNQTSYRLYDDIKQFLMWMHERYKGLYFVTGKERERLKNLIEECGAQEEAKLISRIFTTQELGANKLMKCFWTKVLEKLELEPAQVVTVGNDITIDGVSALAGIPTLVLDRDGTVESFYRDKGNTWRKIPLLKMEDDLPPKAAFIGFAKDPCELQKWLEKISADS